MISALLLSLLLVLPTVACGPAADDAMPVNAPPQDESAANADTNVGGAEDAVEEMPAADMGDLPPVPDAFADAFVVGDDPFVSAATVGAALDAGMDIQFIDARPSVDYEFGHVPGAINVVYSDASNYDVSTLPTDRWLVAYCECPHAEAQQVYDALRAKGVANIKVMDEGLAGWRDVLGRDLETSPASSEG